MTLDALLKRALRDKHDRSLAFFPTLGQAGVCKAAATLLNLVANRISMARLSKVIRSLDIKRFQAFGHTRYYPQNVSELHVNAFSGSEWTLVASA